jgi:hypothetical protein
MMVALQERRESLRLAWFDRRHGDPQALLALRKTLGWREALQVALTTKHRLRHASPFAQINDQSPPTAKERLSQRQMGPLIVLDRVLADRGHDLTARLRVLQAVSHRVGMAFLRYNIPVIDATQYQRDSAEKRQQLASRLAGHFFNADGVIAPTPAGFSFTVHHCHFARYAAQLDVQHLMPLFCGIDADYVREHQPDVVFFRSTTLAAQGQPCDFRFEVRGGAPRSDNGLP